MATLGVIFGKAGETELGRSAGFISAMTRLLSVNASRWACPPTRRSRRVWPDGIKRERERTRESWPSSSSTDLVRERDAASHVGNAESCRRAIAVLRHGRNQCHAENLLPANRKAAGRNHCAGLGMIQVSPNPLCCRWPRLVCGWLGAETANDAVLLATIFITWCRARCAHTEIRYVLRFTDCYRSLRR